MKVPNFDRAVIPEQKISGYLLSDGHPVGRLKAAFFRALGYSSEAPHVLADALRAQLENDVTARTETEFGVKYEVRCELAGPGGATRMVVTVWIVLTDEDYPRLIMAYPGD